MQERKWQHMQVAAHVPQMRDAHLPCSCSDQNAPFNGRIVGMHGSGAPPALPRAWLTAQCATGAGQCSSLMPRLSQ